jgi:hypothetical protein
MGLDELYDRLEEMVMVCNSFPSPIKKQKLAFWPEYTNDANLAYGYNETKVHIKPTNQMIDRCDEALLWVLDMSLEDRKIVWLRGSKMSWRKICTFFSCNKDTAKARHTLALVRLQHQLRQK